ncbi:hypothetical protein [Acinetobacter sp.]|uniref:hypothetical protein n=1 Tax=Acinetobacter sp. TaxID=472 RepID=UPI00388DEDEE
MKLTQILLASTFTIAAATTFAATDKQTKEEKVVISTQEQPASTADSTVDQPTTNQPASDKTTEEKTTKTTQSTK